MHRPVTPSGRIAPRPSYAPPAREVVERWRPSLAAKTGLSAVLVATLCALLAAGTLLVGFAAFTSDHDGPLTFDGVRRGMVGTMVVAAIVPIVFAGVVSYFYGKIVTRTRVEPLVHAMRRIAAGDMSPELPDPAETEFLSVNDSFEQMRAALLDALVKLEHQDSQRRRFFADLGHDLATPVSTVLSLVDTLRTESLVPTEAERDRLTAALEREAERLARLATDIRELAYLDDPDVRIRRRTQDVGAVVRDVVETVQLGSPGRRIRCEVESLRAKVDRTRIEQVVHNLLANAMRHTPETGEIRVTVDTEVGFPRIVVEDDGPGVSDDTLMKLGERFFRTDRARGRSSGGHGLGLSIVAAIVERHDGTLHFEHAESGGLRVVILLPADGIPPDPASNHPPKV